MLVDPNVVLNISKHLMQAYQIKRQPFLVESDVINVLESISPENVTVTVEKNRRLDIWSDDEDNEFLN